MLKKTNENKKTVGLKELRLNIDKYIDRVQEGDSITVYRRSEPVFRIVPIDDEEDEKGWKTIIDFTKISKNGVSAREVLKALKDIDG